MRTIPSDWHAQRLRFVLPCIAHLFSGFGVLQRMEVGFYLSIAPARRLTGTDQKGMRRACYPGRRKYCLKGLLQSVSNEAWHLEAIPFSAISRSMCFMRGLDPALLLEPYAWLNCCA